MIVYCCADLIFSTKVASTCEALGVVSRPARDVGMLRRRLDRVDDGKANGAVAAVMVDLEAGEGALELIRVAAGHGADPAVIAFGPHVMTEALAAAEEAGADAVMARGAFTRELPELVKRFGAGVR